MNFSVAIGNPPYVGVPGKSDRERSRKEGRYLAKKIFDVAKVNAEKTIFLMPSSYIAQKKDQYTGFEDFGQFPGVGQTVGIYEYERNKPFVNVTDDNETKRRNKIIEEHKVRNSLYERLKWAKSEMVGKIDGIKETYIYAFSKGVVVPQNYIAVPISNGHLRTFMPGELPVKVNGNNKPVVVVYLSCRGTTPELLNAYLMKNKEKIESYFNTASIVMGFKCIKDINT